jgi:hypothetical protein
LNKQANEKEMNDSNCCYPNSCNEHLYPHSSLVKTTNQDWMTFAHVEGLRLKYQKLINYFQNFANETKFLKRSK